MKCRFFILLLLIGCRLFSQDRIYLQDGSCKVAKVLEIGPEEITVVPISESGAPFINADEKISKSEVILIEYKNGTVDYLQSPKKDLVSDETGASEKSRKPLTDKIQYQNLVSINSLGLFNSDISGFFEHLTDNSLFGFGVMGAYNFNKYASAQNNFISILNAAKKQYDIGAFVNFYPSRFRRRTNFFMGLMMKYTAFTFSSITELSSGGQTSFKYTPAKGSQLATLFIIGNHRNLSKTVFIRSTFGLGGFTLRGDYKTQYNYRLRTLQNASQTGSTNTTIGTVNMLPKLYFGLNIGFRF